ncbi:MAG: ccmB [Rickettsiaceae bacterium]|jgi:ABC-type transport system involved in cytochrome c biogenesis permease component|nr:ccmB [Rickettsiaceae bacterium]
MIFPNFRHELTNHFKVYNTVTYLLLFLIFTFVCMVFIIPQDAIVHQAPALLLIILPIAQISNTASLFQMDYKDGTLELALATRSADNIVYNKFTAITIISFSVMLLVLPIFSVLYSINLNEALRLSLIYGLMLSYINAFTVLIGAVQVYFGAACNFIATLIFPLLIPGIICGVLSIMNSANFVLYLKLLLGLNFILVPIILVMTSYLVRNIYNI